MKRHFTLLASVFAVTVGMATLGEAAEVIVRVAPPPPASTAVIGVAPGPRHVWIPGYQKWNGNSYVWVAGRWMIPPRAGVVWVPPHWAPRRGGYVFVPGHWK
jgi:hypothetical protein